MAITKIHAVKVRLGDAINYIENPDKTDGQELISGYNTSTLRSSMFNAYFFIALCSFAFVFSVAHISL